MIPSIEPWAAGQNTTSATQPDFGTRLAQASTRKDPSFTEPFTDRNLYGPNGPRPEDVGQNSLDNCYFVVALSAFARQQPELIRNQIAYDPKTQNFHVTLYKDPDPKSPHNPHQPVTVEVTQTEVVLNLARGGASIDDSGSGPIWPSVMETARAKMLDGNHADGLDQGYHALEHQAPGGRAGGDPSKAMETVSGQPAKRASSEPVTYGDAPPDGLWRLPEVLSPATAFSRYLVDSWKDNRYNEIKNALADGRPVTLSTMPENRQDGLAENHIYQVESIRKDASGDIEITMRNPWGHNDVREGIGDDKNPVVTIKSETLGPSLAQFNIGPTPQQTGVG